MRLRVTRPVLTRLPGLSSHFDQDPDYSLCLNFPEAIKHILLSNLAEYAGAAHQAQPNLVTIDMPGILSMNITIEEAPRRKQSLAATGAALATKLKSEVSVYAQVQ